MKKWKCEVCGYIHSGDKPPAKCPVCGAPQSAFVLIEDPEADTPVSSASAEAPAPKAGPERRWKCLVCGYIHTGAEPPEKCPVCGAPKSRFELVDEPQEEHSKKPAETAQETEAPIQKAASTAKPLSQLIERAELLTRLHGHPIAVHIPNGVLPLTFLFTLLAIVFSSEGLATAARYNMIFVCLSMPIVLATGIVDWFNRFNAQITTVFKIKMACGAAVTILSLILALWWTVDPEIYVGGDKKSGLFLFLNLIDLGIAAIAGFYGGKLVFRE